MPESEAFDFRNFFFKWVLFVSQKRSGFLRLLEQLIQLLFDNLSHAEVLYLYLQY